MKSDCDTAVARQPVSDDSFYLSVTERTQYRDCRGTQRCTYTNRENRPKIRSDVCPIRTIQCVNRKSLEQNK